MSTFQSKRPFHANRRNWFQISLTAIAGAIAFFQAATSQALTSHNVTVPGTVAWYDTGIFVNAGETLDIFASGQVVYGTMLQQVTGPGGTNYNGQQFFGTAVIPDATIVSLIGKIGGTTAIGTGTLLPGGLPGNGPGYVGASYHQMVNVSGNLFLGFNDQKNAFADNSGSFNAIVTVPEPSSVALTGLGAVAFGFFRRKRNA